MDSYISSNIYIYIYIYTHEFIYFNMYPGRIYLVPQFLFEIFFGKTHFEAPVFLFFSIFRLYTFILRHYILILLFSYKFRPSVRAR